MTYEADYDIFRAATVNVYHSTPLGRIERGIKLIKSHGVSLISFQEALQPGLQELLNAFGFESVRWGASVVAWELAAPPRWTPIASWNTVLSTSAYFRKGQTRPIRPNMATVILCDYLGRTLTKGSYHLPPNTQNRATGDYNFKVRRRIEVLKESTETFGHISRSSKTTAVCLSGDDNVEEGVGDWPIMRRPVTGLKLIQSPTPTKGKRRIDDFRTRGLILEDNYSIPGIGTERDPHAIHIAAFSWRK